LKLTPHLHGCSKSQTRIPKPNVYHFLPISTLLSSTTNSHITPLKEDYQTNTSFFQNLG
jgi:hypothetical protein